MPTTSTTTIHLEFDVPAGVGGRWRALWDELGRLALESFECRGFKAVSRDDRWIVESEWRNRSDFNRFIRSAGVLWIDRSTWHSGLLPHSVVEGPRMEVETVLVAPAARAVR